ncbi:hypothetical protein NPX13_g4827 [Xylaria arbuscula]|uniref:Myb-like domain-containing protein n=1 Tax=Xylaria arbuscula TaxID=114810 RepID=A0A9W8NFB5_9PEZI|nr:hypothetical protein NPX13_g4827 [Xylaria arbuscula]
MFDMRPKQPPHRQLVWQQYRDRLPGKSHPHRYREEGSFPVIYGSLIDTPGFFIVDQDYPRQLFQQRFQPMMDNRTLYQHGIDSGDESIMFNDYLAADPHAVGTGMQNVRSQTAARSVSLANCGRDVGPSHPEYSNKAALGNEQAISPDHPAANAYAYGLSSSFAQQQIPFPCPSSEYRNPIFEFDFHHGLLAASEAYANMSGAAESFGYTRSSPTTLNSSFSSSDGSSIASEGMASMSLESAPLQGCTSSMDFQNTCHVSSMDIHGEDWAAAYPATISPKMLRINPSPTPTSSSESIQASIQTINADSDLGSSAWNQHDGGSVVPTKCLHHKPRKELPTKPTKAPLMTSSTSRRSAISKGKGKAYVQPELPPQCSDEDIQERTTPRSRRLMDADDLVDPIPSTSSDAEREAKNRFLVDSKLAGMTYREIRLQGGFTEAESTLRGRFRTLTKNKEQRVRKPEWQDKDIRLLKRAVRKLAKGGKDSARVPWKQVAAYIFEHDGSYHFGNATCRKKWDELVEEEAEGR